MNISFQPLNPPWTQASSKALTMWAHEDVVRCSNHGCVYFLFYFIFNFYSELNPLLHVLGEIEDVYVTHAKPHIISQQEETSVWKGRRQGEGSVYWPLIVSLWSF